MSKYVWPWTMKRFDAAMRRDGWRDVQQRDLFGAVFGVIWRHDNGATFDPMAPTGNGNVAWQQWAAAHETPPPF